MNATHAQLSAEFIGVPAEQLADGALLGGLLVAAASAAGLGGTHPPIVRERGDGGVSAALLLDGAHITVHSFADSRRVLFEVLAPTSHDFRKALDVFARRLTAREVHSDLRARG